ncbi:hypothetical protein BG842_22525 [Haladaptatus sp. W1]|nr:hypothetical protein BG842_22525 [Haladaptatus sp. W1]
MLEVDMILGWPAERRVEEITTEELLASSSSYGVAELRGDRVRLLLFIYLRDCLERWVDGLESVSGTPWQDTVQRYCADDEMLFRRLGLHLVTVRRDATPELAAACALDLENYANRGLQRESVPLLYLLYHKRNDLREEIETFLNQAVDEEGWAETTRQAILTAESVDGVLETLTVVNAESDEETHESAEESLIETEIARHDSSPLFTSESPEEIVSYCAALDSNASTEELSAVITQISQLLETDSEKYFPVLPALVPESEFLLLRILERYAGRTPEALSEPPVFGKLIEACRSILDQTSFENTAVASGIIDTLRTLNDWKEVAPQSDMTAARELLLDIAAAYDVQTLDEADTVGYDWRGAEPILRKDVPPQAVEAFVRLAKRMDTEDDSLSIEDRVSSLPVSERVAGLQLNSGQESYRNPYQDLEIVPILDVVGVWGARTLVEELTETFLPAEQYVKEILVSANRLLQEGRKDNVVSIFDGFVSSMNEDLLLDVRFNDNELSTLLDGYALLINYITNFGSRFSTLCRQVIILYLQTDDRVDDEQSLIRTLYALPSEATSGNSIESDIAIALKNLANDEWSRNLNWRKAVDIWEWRVQGFDGQIVNDHWTEVSHLVKAISILQSEFESNWPIDEELLDRVELESCKIWRSGDDEIVLVTREWAINHQDTAEFVGQFFSDQFTASPRATYFLLNYRDLEAPLDLWHDSILLAREDLFAWPWLLRGIASMALLRREDSIELLEKLLRLIPLSSSWEFVLERYEEYILVTLCLALDFEETHGKARSVMDLYARKFNRVEILELLEGIAQDFPRE